MSFGWSWASAELRLSFGSGLLSRMKVKPTIRRIPLLLKISAKVFAGHHLHLQRVARLHWTLPNSERGSWGLFHTNPLKRKVVRHFRGHQHMSHNTFIFPYTMWVASPWGFSEKTIQPARHECHACGPLQAEKPGTQPVVGNTHGSHVKQVVSSFQKILRGSQLTWYLKGRTECFQIRGDFI